MKKVNLLLGLEAVALAAVLVIGLAVLMPAEAEASQCSPYGWRTVNAWGMGATCTAARNDCIANAWQAAEDYCGARDVCDSQPVVFHSADCYYANGQQNIDCHMDFKCTFGFPPP